MTSSSPTAIAAPSTPARLDAAPSWWDRTNKATAAMVAVTALVLLGFGATAPNFLSVGNLANLATQVAITLIVAVAMTFVITSGQIDLSVGATLAFVAALSAQLLEAGWDSSVVILVGLLAGGLWGALNGWLSAYLLIPPFIVTLAAMSVIRGLAQWSTQGFSIPIDSRLYLAELGTATFLGFSVLAWIALIIAVVGGIVLARTPFGRHVTGIGAQEESVRRAGVDIRRVKLAVFVLAGVAAGLAGLLTAARLGSGSSNSGQAFELTVIAAVVLGGTNLFGGRGTIVGTVVGAVLIGTIANGLTLLGVSPFVSPVITGLVLVAAVGLNMRGHRLAELGSLLTGRRG